MSDREVLEKWTTEMETRLSTSHGSERRYLDAVKKIKAIRNVLAENERLKAKVGIEDMRHSIETALALHSEKVLSLSSICNHCQYPFPCPTVKALRGEE